MVRITHEKSRSRVVGHNLPVHHGEIAGYLLLICVVVVDEVVVEIDQLRRLVFGITKRVVEW